MKFHLLNLQLAALGPLMAMLPMASVSYAEDAPVPSVPQMQDAETHEQIVLKLRKAEQVNPMLHMQPSTGADPAKVNRPESLLGNSDIVCFGGMAVLVPKRAILQIPEKLADRLKFQPGAQFQSWADFYAANRGWITTVEVTPAQAEGSLELEKDARERLQKSSNLIVATYKGGPISVLPLKIPLANTSPGSKP